MELVKAPVDTRRKEEFGVFLAVHVKGAEDGEAWDEPEPEGDVSGVGCFGDGEGPCSVAVVIVDCPSERDAVEGTVDVVLLRRGVQELNESKLFGGRSGGVGRQLYEMRKKDECADPDDGSTAGGTGAESENVRDFEILERAKG